MTAAAKMTLSSLLLAALAACGGGGSGPIEPTVGASSGYDDPGTTRDVPTGDGTQSSACIACDVVYDCSGGQNVSLSSSQGECTQQLIDEVCSGVIFGATSCTGGGGGAFSCGAVTCTPEQPGGGSFADGG